MKVITKTIVTILILAGIIAVAQIAECYILNQQKYWYNRGRDEQRIRSYKSVESILDENRRLKIDNWNMRQARIKFKALSLNKKKH